MRNILLATACTIALTVSAYAHGGSNINLNGAWAGASATSYANASARASAWQSQGQWQAQSQSLRNTNTATGGSSQATGGSSTNIISAGNSNVPWWGGGSSVAIAPGNSVGNGVCASTASFAAGFIGSLSFGFPTTDHSCNVRANYTTFKLPPKVKRKLMCEDRYMNAAFIAAGYSDCNNVHVAN